MHDFSYAHKNTSGGERVTRTAPFNKPDTGEKLSKIRAAAFKEEIPVSDDETLNFLITLVRALRPENILELGTAVGVSGSAMLLNSEKSNLTTIERDEKFCARARDTFSEVGVSDRVTLICGDAGEVINTLDGKYDFIFLDCAKVQYVKYLPRLKTLLRSGGVLLADDVLLFGFVTGEQPVPPKRRMLVEHIKEYISAVTSDPELTTTVVDIGNGVALSVKK